MELNLSDAPASCYRLDRNMDIRKFAADAAEEVVCSYTVGIVGGTDRGPNTGIGTGSAIEWRRHRMILTAAHVINKTDPSQLSFLFRPEGTLQREDVEDRSAGSRFVRRERIEIRSIQRFDADDLALLDVAPNLDTRFHLSFFPLDPAATAPAPGTLLMVQGFPSALAERVYPGAGAANRAISYERVLDHKVVAELGLDPDAHIALRYTFGEHIEPEGVHPRGFSGAGIWFDGGGDSVIWHADFRFAGMITEYCSRRRVLTGLRVEAILRVLDRTWGD